MGAIKKKLSIKKKPEMQRQPSVFDTINANKPARRGTFGMTFNIGGRTSSSAGVEGHGARLGKA